MRALLVNPATPDTYWSQRHALPFVRRKSLLPPLGLITIAGLLPRHWQLQLVDLSVEPLADEAIAGADVVLLTGMIAQRASLHDILARCRRAGVPSIVGGPYATAMPDDLDAADIVVMGEAEALMAGIAADFEAGRAARRYTAPHRPDLADSPVPRYDLLRRGAYAQLAVQFSRGCPWACEFCDISVMFGRSPRTKSPAQIVAELEAICRTGYRGDVFFVDDNFIGNRRAVRALLPEVGAWRRRTGAQMTFFTEASTDLAQDDDLMSSMIDAGFTSVFVGIETPSEEALRETHKLQNVRRDLTESVHHMLRRGLDVWGGFILGFDSEGRDIFDRMIRFVQDAAIPYAMVGLLNALPNTPLHRRLGSEGRLRPLDDAQCDQFGGTNIITKMDTQTLLTGYHRVLETLYEPAAYFARCRENLKLWNGRRAARRGYLGVELLAGLRSLLVQGMSADYRRQYRSFLRWTALHRPTALGRAIAQSIVGHHYITYTRDTVLPALRRQIDAAAAATPAPPDAACCPAPETP
jgi:radical SAM superfamily enzyme YgiQ (UPF0313 family)